MKVEVDVLGSHSLIVLTVSVDIKQHCAVSELRSCVKVEVDVLGSLCYGLCGRKGRSCPWYQKSGACNIDVIGHLLCSACPANFHKQNYVLKFNIKSREHF